MEILIGLIIFIFMIVACAILSRTGEKNANLQNEFDMPVVVAESNKKSEKQEHSGGILRGWGQPVFVILALLLSCVVTKLLEDINNSSKKENTYSAPIQQVSYSNISKEQENKKNDEYENIKFRPKNNVKKKGPEKYYYQDGYGQLHEIEMEEHKEVYDPFNSGIRRKDVHRMLAGGDPDHPLVEFDDFGGVKFHPENVGKATPAKYYRDEYGNLHELKTKEQIKKEKK